MTDIIEEFYVENREKLVKRVSFRVGGVHNAEDVVQEAFVRALQYRSSFNPEVQEFGAWFNTILNNAARAFKREDKMEGMTTTELTEPLEDDLAREVMSSTIEKEIADWKPVQREALRLFFTLGYTAREISEIMPYKIGMIRFIVREFSTFMKGKYSADLRS